MIVLDIEDYCQQCLDFCPEVIKAQRIMFDHGEMAYSNTIIQCEHRKRCAGITRFLEQRIREAETK